MKRELPEANSDVIRLFEIAKSIGWDDLREQSIHRILYLSSVLYGFMYPGEHFKEGYDFTVDLTGPYSKEIKDAIVYLDANDIIYRRKDNEYLIDMALVPDLSKSFMHERKIEWLKTVMYVLGLYGETKVYDFVIRDPEYRVNDMSNSTQTIKTDGANRTTQTLAELKRQFDFYLNDKGITLNKEKYLELYFEYVFSKVLTGNV